MKKGFIRIVCTLLVLMLCLGQLVGIVPANAATTVEYRYGSGNVIYNWGERGVTADFLSPNAESFYDTYTSYEELAQLSGSSSISSLNTSALFKQLRSLVTNAQTEETSYGGTRELYQYTDCQNNAYTTTKISSFYSGDLIGPAWDGGETWNREHTWPNSKGDANGNGENDIMMLRPTAKSENGSRSNKAYGVSSGYYNPNGESNGSYDLRGDVARIVLYVYVRWSTASPSVMFGSEGVIESKEVLLDWMEADPVDTWELGRNDSVESITGTRNVFVDYPELAFLLFNEEIPSDMTTPSGEAAPDYTITATSNNTAYGTVSVNGKTIFASPNAGYQVSGYTVLSGSATVTQSGNTFTVTATADCSIRINFTAKPVYTATFTENGAITGTASSYDTVTLPDCTAGPTNGYTFGGWVTAAVEETDTRPTPVYAAGTAYTLTKDTAFHALYYIRTEEGTSDDTFELYSGELTDGDYLITYNDAALTASINSGTRFDYTVITATDGTVNTTDGAIIWTVEKQADGYYTLYNASTGMYAAGNGTKNNGALIASVTDYAKWTATGSSTYEFRNLGNTDNGVNAYLRRNGTYGFATYSTSTGGALTLYKRGSGSTLYTTSLPTQSYTVTFVDYDGTVLATANYKEGDTVEVPADPTRPADESYTYAFTGWTPAVTVVTGDATYTATYTATEIVVENAIVKQPADNSAKSGEKVQFSVTAQGDIVSYKWEYRQIYKWFNTSMTGYDTDTLTVTATGARNGYDYRCVVTFADGTVLTSEFAELTVETEITDVGSPNDQVVVNGYKGQFTASATGEGLKYRWYYQRPSGTVWSETAMEGCERPTVYIESTAARDGYKYKCRITDVTGNVVYTEVATMRVLTFTSQPQNATGSVGDDVTFTVATSVDSGFTYQWQYRRSATASWSNTTMTGYNTDTLTVSATAARNGYQYRCVLTGSKNSKLESNAATLTVAEPVTITAQPQNVSCAVGEIAAFTVTAANVASYQWQYQSATSTTRWSNTGATGNKTATLNITATTGNNGYKYRCLIIGTDGSEYITEVATLTTY